MRMRHKPWARPELEACPFFVPDSYALRGRWSALFAGRSVTVELGCGKGGFIAAEIAAHPDRFFLAVDIKDAVLASAKRNIEAACAAPPANVLLFSHDIARIHQLELPAHSVDRLYILFPNPWPKESHQKRRLTHPRQLAQYAPFLAPDATVVFKTDDAALYRDSLDYFAQSGYRSLRSTGDLYAAEPPVGALTEHEQLFRAQNLPIHLIEAHPPTERHDTGKRDL